MKLRKDLVTKYKINISTIKSQICRISDSLKDIGLNGVCFDGRKFVAVGNENEQLL